MKYVRSLAVALFALALAPASLARCGAEVAPPHETAEGFIYSETPLFVIDDKGRLHRGGFDQRAWVLVVDHGMRNDPIMFVASGGRWILYGEQGIRDLPNPRRWLHDTQTGTEITVPADAELSPDGHHLIYQDADSLVLVDTGTSAERRIRLPEMREYSDYDWSVDGELFLWSGFTPRLTWVFDPVDGGFEPIEGGLEPGEGTVYRRNGVAIKEGEAWNPMRTTSRRKVSTDGMATAEVGGGYRLTVKVGNEAARTVATGRYDDCEGLMIGIHGWLDGHDYLVYQLESIIHIYSVAADRSVRLFDDQTAVAGFAWPGWTLDGDAAPGE